MFVNNAEYEAERNTLLARISSVLRADDRVVAAWLFGSFGRGEADVLSDLDVWVVVADEHIAEFVAQRQAYAARVGMTLFYVEAPQNAPRDGAYLMAYYDAPVAPHHVDWYWQPRSQASIPQQTQLLFDRAGLPRFGAATPPGQGTPPERSRIEAVDLAIRFFWAMLMIAAKYAARSPDEKVMGLLPYVCGPLEEVRHFVGDDSLLVELPPHAQPHEKLALLRRLAATMGELMTKARDCGAQVPDGVAMSAGRYLDLVAPVLAESTVPTKR